MTTPTASPEKPQVKSIAKPNALQLCDRCGATALFVLELPVSELLFCGTHAASTGLVSKAEALAAQQAVYGGGNRQQGSDH